MSASRSFTRSGRAKTKAGAALAAAKPPCIDCGTDYGPAATAAHALGKVGGIERGVDLLEREELLEKVRDGQHRRAHVEGEPVARAHVSAASRPSEMLESGAGEVHSRRAGPRGERAAPPPE